MEVGYPEGGDTHHEASGLSYSELGPAHPPFRHGSVNSWGEHWSFCIFRGIEGTNGKHIKPTVCK